MQLDGDDLLARIRQDFPVEFELAQLRCLADMQAAEIERLTALVPTSSYATASTRPFSLSDEEVRRD